MIARIISPTAQLQKESVQNDEVIENDALRDVLQKTNFLTSTDRKNLNQVKFRHCEKTHFHRFTCTTRSEHASCRSFSRYRSPQLGS